MKRLIEAWRSKIEWNTPRFNRRLVSVAKNPSTAFSHEHEVGVKLRHVAVLADPNVDKPPHLQALTASAKARGIELSVFSAETPEEIVPALDAAKSSGAGAINVLATDLF